MTDAQTIQNYLNEVATGSFVTMPPGSYSIDTPLTLAFAKSCRGSGVDLRGVELKSALTVSEPLLTISVAANVFVRDFYHIGGCYTGGASETHNLAVICTNTDGMLYNAVFRDISSENANKDGLYAVGYLFETSLLNFNSSSNKGNGATLGNPASGTPGIMSTMHWRDGSLRLNGGYGTQLIGEFYDLRRRDTYHVQNGLAAINAPNGISLLDGCGFENNRMAATETNGPALELQNFATIRNCTEGKELSDSHQTSFLDIYLVGNLTVEDVRPGTSFGSLRGKGTARLRNVTGAMTKESGVIMV